MKHSQIEVAPSILSGDFGKLSAEAKRIEKAGADAIHLDIMDGHFVPNLTFGPRAVAAINRATDLFLDVHLMIYSPFNYVERFIEAGADRITFHLEATEEIEDTIQYIKKCNAQVGISLRPETSVELLAKYLDQIDLVLIMTVNPGFGGQKFMEEMVEKIRFIKMAREKRDLKLKIQVDGGINAKTAKACVEAGADVLVAGSYLFGLSDMETGIQLLKGLNV